MPSFEKAMADGATALETDAHKTKDGHVVLAHDADLSRVFGLPLVIHEATLAELQAKAPIPTLRDLLERFPQVPINIDIKARGMEAEIVRVIVDAGAAERVLLASFHADALRRVRALGYPGPTGLGRDEIVRLVAVPKPLLRMWPLKGTRAQVPRRTGPLRFDTPSFIARCHSLGIRVDFWTINDAEEARELLALGADGIMSDAPGAVRRAFSG
jgi:glycerophosphoryl diester phosphodiesterase